MNREQAIELIKLLSALESWGFAALWYVWPDD